MHTVKKNTMLIAKKVLKIFYQKEYKLYIDVKSKIKPATIANG